MSQYVECVQKDKFPPDGPQTHFLRCGNSAKQYTQMQSFFVPLPALYSLWQTNYYNQNAMHNCALTHFGIQIGIIIFSFFAHMCLQPIHKLWSPTRDWLYYMKAVFLSSLFHFHAWCETRCKMSTIRKHLAEVER